MTQTLTQTHSRRPRPLSFSPSSAQIEEFAESLAGFAPDSDVSFGWLKETLLALPEPPPAEKKENLDLVARHAVLTYKIGKLRSMLAWFAEDVRDFGYWKSPDVRQAVQETVKALRQTLQALESEFGQDAQLLTAHEEKAVQFYYDDAAERFML